MSRRAERVGELLREELSQLLLRRLQDPRLAPLITITEVKVTPDLSQAKVYFSVMGTEEEKAAAHRALEAASGYLRRQLG
ncbi:MAG TPA: 30S ribosome-binding factor RbfA, partial [Dehalococcoidia bacterium]|nr:30S ribosome-binding factor RbfA [Dehalococcoidia bacterium]